MKYAIISNQKRQDLLRRVIKEKQSIKQVAQQLKIKFPSAKSILRNYKKTGLIFNKKKMRKSNFQYLQKILPKKQQKCKIQDKQQDGHQNKPIQNQQKKQIPVHFQINFQQLYNACPLVSGYPLISPYGYSPYNYCQLMPFNVNNFTG